MLKPGGYGDGRRRSSEAPQPRCSRPADARPTDVVLPFPRAIDVSADSPITTYATSCCRWTSGDQGYGDRLRAARASPFTLRCSSWPRRGRSDRKDLLPGISGRSLLGAGESRAQRTCGDRPAARPASADGCRDAPRFFPRASRSRCRHRRRRPAAPASIGQGGREEGKSASLRETPPAKSLTVFGCRRRSVCDGIDFPANAAIKDRWCCPWTSKRSARAATPRGERDDDDGDAARRVHEGLLAIGDWDFGWQDSYFYKSPIVLPGHQSRRRDRIRQLG